MRLSALAASAAALALGFAPLAQAQVHLPASGTLNSAQPIFCVNPTTAAIEDCNTNVTTLPGAVTPAAGTAHIVVTGGTAVTMVTGPVKGCYILNPSTAADQNIGAAETAYVNIVTTATTTALNGSSTPILAGTTFYCPAGMTTNASVNAATSAHNLVVVVW